MTSRVVLRRLPSKVPRASQNHSIPLCLPLTSDRIVKEPTDTADTTGRGHLPEEVGTGLQ